MLTRAKNGQAPRKIELGGWMLPAMRWLAKGKVLRGGAFDVFGRTDERRMERELIAQYEARVRELLPQLTADRIKLATDIAAVPMSMRGFGHVKHANVLLARVRETELLYRFNPEHYPAPPRQPKAGQLKGIAITTESKVPAAIE